MDAASDLHRRLAEHPSIVFALLFGSRGRGDARPDSDWNAGLLAQTERWMHLMVEAAIDLAQHLIASRGWRTPATNREAFQILRENGVLSEELGEQMEGWAGLRNVLVHLYLEIDHGLLLTILQEELDQPRAFAVALTKILDEDDEQS